MLADVFTKPLSLQKIRLNVSLEFEPKIAAVEKEINDLQGQLKWTGGTEAVELREKIAKKEKEVAQIYKDQSASIDEQYKIQKGQDTAKKILIDGLEEEESLSTELTDAEKEHLSIEKELLKFRFDNVDALEAQVQKEIELVTQSKTLYEAHVKNLKLEELSTKLLDVKLQKRKQEEDSLRNLVMQYDKANIFDKARIKRATELLKLSPIELGRTYENDVYDKNIIIDYWNSFSVEGKRAIEEVQARLSDISISGKTDFDLQLEAITRLQELLKLGSPLQGAQGINPTTITNYGAQNVNISVDAGGMSTVEEVTNLINKMITEKLMADESFINAFVKRISPKI
jgi:hypothetical protein